MTWFLQLNSFKDKKMLNSSKKHSWRMHLIQQCSKRLQEVFKTSVKMFISGGMLDVRVYFINVLKVCFQTVF